MKYMIFYVDPKPGSREKPIEAYHTGKRNSHGSRKQSRGNI